MNTPPIKRSMVGWYDPRQLMNTGIQVLVSDLIGTRFDTRREQALAVEKLEQPKDYNSRRNLQNATLRPDWKVVQVALRPSGKLRSGTTIMKIRINWVSLVRIGLLIKFNRQN